MSYSSVWSLCQLLLFALQVSKAKDLLNEESKQHAMIVEREGKYLPVVDEPRRPKPKSVSDGESLSVLQAFSSLLVNLV